MVENVMYFRKKIESEGVGVLDALVGAKKKEQGSLNDSIHILTQLYDFADCIKQRKNRLLHALDDALVDVFNGISPINSDKPYSRLDFANKDLLKSPKEFEKHLVIDALDFPNGDEFLSGLETLSSQIVKAYTLGWKNVLVYNLRGNKYIGCGIGPESNGFVLDVYGDCGNYVGSGMSGFTLNIHGSVQDMAAQIMHSGKLVVHGDVGQTFMYGAKGGRAFVRGNACGRAVINAVGSPKVVINGTCLDYLAESLMTGDPLNNGGFVVLNGIKQTPQGFKDLEPVYSGGNLLSLASGGALYIRDPQNTISQDQLNGGVLSKIGYEDWRVLKPLLKENENLFGISIDDLLSGMDFNEVYKKIIPVTSKALK